MAQPAAILSVMVEANTGKATSSLRKFDSSLSHSSSSANKAVKTTDRLGKSSRSLGTHLSNVAKYAVGAAAAYIGISEAKDAISTTEDLAKATISLNKNLGLSVKTASEWAAVAKTRGVDSQKLGMAFKTLSSQVDSAAQGSATAQKEFKRLGISQRELGKDSHNVNQLLFDVSDGIHKLGAGTARTTIESKLFGRGWQTIVPVLRDGSKELKNQLGLANKYGATFGGKTLNSVYDLVKAQRELQFAQLGIQIAFTEKVAPALIKVGLGIAKFINEMRTGTGAGGKFASVMRAVGKGLEVLYSIIRRAVIIIAGIVRVVRKVIDAFSGMRASNKTVIASFRGLGQTLGNIASGLASPFIRATKAIIATFKRMGHGIGNVVTGIAHAVGTVATVIRTVVGFIVRAVNKAVGALGDLKDKIPSISLPDISLPSPGDVLGGITGQTGVIVPGTGTGDKVPAMLEPGEVVLNRKAVAAMGGAQRANEINRQVPRFAKGGTVPPIHVGGSGPLAGMTQAGVNTMRGAANRYIKRHRPKGGLGGLNVPTGPIVQMARQMVAQAFGAGQWGPFKALEMQEAGFNPRALNPTSGAAGLAQALPASKYPPGAWPYRGLKSAKLQLQWMMQYISGRYGNPAGAWAHEQSAGWYQRGGIVGRGVNFGGHPSNVDPAVARMIGVLENKFGLSVTSTTDGGHVSGSDHYSGHAVDMAGGSMGAAANWIARTKGFYSQLKQGIHNPGLSINAGRYVDPSFWASEWANHRDHIHLAATAFALNKLGGGKGGGGATGSAAPPPKPPKLTITSKQQGKLDKLKKKLKNMGLPNQTTIDSLTAKAAQFEEFAGYASQFQTDDTAAGQGYWKGQPEVSYLLQELGALLELRNQLIAAYEALAAKREKIAKALADAHKTLKALKAIKNPSKQQSQQKMFLAQRIGLLTQEQTKANTLMGGIIGPDGPLVSVQGSVGDMAQASENMRPSNALARFGGSIFDVAKRIADFGVNDSATDTGTTDTTTSDLLRQLLQESNQRFLTSQAQYAVFQNPIMGAFAKGGTAMSRGMYLVGENGPELATLGPGQRVYSNRDSQQMVGANVEVHNYADGTTGVRVNGQWVDARIAKHNRSAGRKASRSLPGSRQVGP